MKPVSTPLAPHFKLSDAMSPKNEVEREYMSRVPYANTIGSLMYATQSSLFNNIPSEIQQRIQAALTTSLAVDSSG
uniref:Uncharacterized protein n=1 Tax=Solanum lycopersicum TaxID=4081 RepID=A0A3Q7J7Q2_SOLLC